MASYFEDRGDDDLGDGGDGEFAVGVTPFGVSSRTVSIALGEDGATNLRTLVVNGGSPPGVVGSRLFAELASRPFAEDGCADNRSTKESS
jgi:hypothetical protein